MDRMTGLMTSCRRRSLCGPRLWLALFAVTVAWLVLGCGSSESSGATPSDPALQGGVLAPAVERPTELAGLLELPSDVEAVVFPWSELTVETGDGELWLGVLVANTEERRQRGLMYWRGLPSQVGMIFIWPEARARSGGFWNPNVPIDLHVAWLDRDGTIMELSTLIAQDATVRAPLAPYYFVLEMPHGRFEQLGIAIGDRVRIPQTLLPSRQPSSGDGS